MGVRTIDASGREEAHNSCSYVTGVRKVYAGIRVALGPGAHTQEVGKEIQR